MPPGDRIATRITVNRPVNPITAGVIGVGKTRTGIAGVIAVD